MNDFFKVFLSPCLISGFESKISVPGIQLYLRNLEYLLLAFIRSLLDLKQDWLKTNPKHARIRFMQ